MKKIAGICAAGILMIGVAACGANDADKGSRDKGPADAINMPNEVPTVFHKCDGKGHRVYVTDRNDGAPGGSITVIADTRCGS